MDIENLAVKSGLSVPDVQSVLNALSDQCVSDLHDKGEFNLFDLAVVRLIQIPGKEAMTGVNPFTNEEQEFKAKPALTKIRFTPSPRFEKALGIER